MVVPFKWIRLFTVLMPIMMVLAGCMLPQQPVVSGPIEPPTPSAQALKLYNQAIDDYLAQNFLAAARTFGDLYAEATDPVIAHRALYGLACTRLMTAQTPTDYREAMLRWHQWAKNAFRDGEDRDLLLIVPIMDEMMIFSHLPDSIDDANAKVHGPAVPFWLYDRVGQELKQTKAQLQEANQSVKQANKKAADLEKEIETLKDQIKAFETIDQGIQQKKDAIPSVD